MVEPWSQAGYECYCVDLQSQAPTSANVHHVQANILDCVSKWLPSGRRVKIAFGFPPCTHTAVSGAKYFRAKGPAHAAEAFTLIARVNELLQWFNAPYLW